MISGNMKADPHCGSIPTPERTDPNTPKVKTVRVNVANYSYVVYEARFNTPGVKTVTEA